MSGSGINPLHVLIIDDQKTMRSIVRGLLQKIGIKDIAEAGGGKEALDHLQDPHANFPDVIICDLHMDEMDGLQFCNFIRRNEKLRNSGVPVVMLTGDRDTFLHDVSRQVGAMSVLTKPITAEELKSEITLAVGYELV
jgi:CheY-like chemotaxis protein